MISSQMGQLLPRCVLCSLCIIARKTVSSSQRLTRYLLITLWSLVAFTKLLLMVLKSKKKWGYGSYSTYHLAER